MMVEVESVGVFSRITLNAKGNKISHLQFVDYTVIFIKNDLEYVLGIKRVLQCFELLSGLSINYGKSSLYGFRIDDRDLKFWASKIGCKLGTLPFSYLRMTLGVNMHRTSSWNLVIDKFKSKLPQSEKQVTKLGWQTCFDEGDSRPNYWFNLFKMPK